MTRLELAYNYFSDAPDDIGLKHRYHAVLLDTDFFIPVLHEDGLLNQALRIQNESTSIFVAFDSEQLFEEWVGRNKDEKNVYKISLSGHQLLNQLPKGSGLLINPMSTMSHILTDEHVVYLKGLLEKMAKGAH